MKKIEWTKSNELIFQFFERDILDGITVFNAQMFSTACALTKLLYSSSYFFYFQNIFFWSFQMQWMRSKDQTRNIFFFLVLIAFRMAMTFPSCCTVGDEGGRRKFNEWISGSSVDFLSSFFFLIFFSYSYFSGRIVSHRSYCRRMTITYLLVRGF